MDITQLLSGLEAGRSTWYRKAWKALVEPAASIQDPAARRSARLLSIFLLCLFALFLCTNVIYLIGVPGYKLPAADLIGYAMLILTYLTSRTRFTGVAVVVLLIMFPLNVFSNVLEGTSLNLAVTLSFLIPSYILASIFLSTLWTGVYGYGVNLLIILLPWLAPGAVPNSNAVFGAVSVGLVSVTLCIVAMIHREGIERERRARLKGDYNNTLVGWSHALEIRDKETEGHSRRVVELTLELAEACGVGGSDLEYVYQGALLHDIGKMAIPDRILFKNTPLDEDEWDVMRTHPKVAYDMLSSISFLEKALVIPAYHHEWWNGGGYPFGLKGEEIPLPARIFAVVDVWDALLSDRPYRKAWTREEVVKYFREQAGRQFDPAIVEQFLALQA
ncbi:MAG TPA: HD-GYP domain-containing protein [Anaerolineales bacterium]|nr:HD-GYP domain-containing protein [Anaerolineales bacterium]